MILLITIILLFLAFIAHVLYWHIQMPKNTTVTLLFIFSSVLATFVLIFYIYQIKGIKSTAQIVQFIMLYGSCALVYIILYSAIEQQSPTLAIINHIYRFGNTGCDKESLLKSLTLDNELSKRIILTQNSGWVNEISGQWQLTNKGKKIAWLFHHAAIIFGLTLGG